MSLHDQLWDSALLIKDFIHVVMATEVFGSRSAEQVSRSCQAEVAMLEEAREFGQGARGRFAGG